MFSKYVDFLYPVNCPCLMKILIESVWRSIIVWYIYIYTMKFVIIGKTTTSNEQNCFWKYLDVLCELAENYLMVSEQEYGLGFCCSRERTGQLTVKHDNEPGDLKTTTTIDDKLKRPVVKLAPMFYESVFQEKNRAGNVGASHQKAEKVDLEHAG